MTKDCFYDVTWPDDLTLIRIHKDRIRPDPSQVEHATMSCSNLIDVLAGLGEYTMVFTNVGAHFDSYSSTNGALLKNKLQVTTGSSNPSIRIDD